MQLGCNPGYYSQQFTDGLCSPCPVNSFSSTAGALNCTNFCPYGRTSCSSSLISAGQCCVCVQGCNGVAGTYSSMPGAISVAQCSVCDSSEACSGHGSCSVSLDGKVVCPLITPLACLPRVHITPRRALGLGVPCDLIRQVSCSCSFGFRGTEDCSYPQEIIIIVTSVVGSLVLFGKKASSYSKPDVVPVVHLFVPPCPLPPFPPAPSYSVSEPEVSACAATGAMPGCEVSATFTTSGLPRLAMRLTSSKRYVGGCAVRAGQISRV